MILYTGKEYMEGYGVNMTSKNYVEIASKIALDAFDQDEGNGTSLSIEDYGLTPEEFVKHVEPNLPEGINDECYDNGDEYYAQCDWQYLDINEENIVFWSESSNDANQEIVFYEHLSTIRNELINSKDYQYNLDGNNMVYDNGKTIQVSGPNEAKLINYMEVSDKARDFALVITLVDYYENLDKVLQELRTVMDVEDLKPYPSGSQVKLKDGKNLPKYDVYQLTHNTFLKVELDGLGETRSDSIDEIEWEVRTTMPEKTPNPYYPKSAQDLADHLPLTINQDANLETLQANIEDISFDQHPDFDKCNTFEKFKDELTKFYIWDIIGDFQFTYCNLLAEDNGYGWEIVSNLVGNDIYEEGKIVEKVYQEQNWLDPNVMEELFNNRENLIDFLKEKEEDYDI